MRASRLTTITALLSLACAGPAPAPQYSVMTSSCSTSNCVSATNTCGQTYGGCYAACPGLPTPTYAAPICPTITATNPLSNLTAVNIADPCESTICVDYINTCTLRYGGCFEACGDFTTPKFEVPGCPTSSTTSSRGKKVVVTATATATVMDVDELAWYRKGSGELREPERTSG
ncbi:hypothetical protein LTR62_007661 [Meristemomyces frigidus]|uniref:Uncharacterized protein n=1 Tax=Meristemomyces frigidus TaxID=1508187 RepID=A0AAN7TLX7_9PEZI|nr:hypothetical protein LTR62_007661 [Meristemomyces frigidus]